MRIGCWLFYILLAGCSLDWSGGEQGPGVDASIDAAADGSPIDGEVTSGDAAQAVPFVVTALSPTEQAPLEDVLAFVEVTLSEEVDAASVTEDSFRVLRDGRSVSGRRRAVGRTLSFEPDVPWALAGRYQVELDARIESTQHHKLTASTHAFGVRDGTWDVRRLDGGYKRVDLAITSDGKACAVWDKTIATGYQLWASRFAPGTSWTEPQAIQRNTPGAPPLPSRQTIAFDSNARIYASWFQDQVYASQYDGVRWQEQELIAGNYANRPSVVVANEKAFVSLFVANALKVFEYEVGLGGKEIYSAPVMDSSGPFDIAAGVVGDQPFVVWDDGPVGADGHSVWLHRLAAQAAAPIALSAPGAAGAAVRVGWSKSAASAFAIWEQLEGDRTDIWASQIDATGVPTPAARLSDGTHACSQPSVAVDDRGNAIAVWEQVSGSGREITAARFEAENGWQPAVRVSEKGNGTATQPVCAVEPGGNGIVIWTQSEADDPTLVDTWVARFVLEADFVDSQRKVVSTTRRVVPGAYVPGSHAMPWPGRPTVGLDERGRAIAAWLENGAVWVGRFD